MDIGFAIKYLKGMRNFKRHFIGEEEYAESLCRELRQMKGITSAQLYAPNFMPSAKIDVMIHLNETLPGPFAQKHILYMQNFFPQGSDVVLHHLRNVEYDGYIFISNKLLELHRLVGYNGILLPLAADTAIFQPKPTNQKYEYDVAYVGNDIKGEERTTHYIYPASKYKFGLFGDWRSSPEPPACYKYRNLLASLSQGTVTREEQASLYSNAKIILNCTGQDAVDWDAMNLRFFEVLACKGFLISDKVPSAEREFKEYVVFTDGDDDLIQKIDYYLARPKERKEIAENGFQYVVQNATIQARAKQLYNYLQEIMSS